VPVQAVAGVPDHHCERQQRQCGQQRLQPDHPGVRAEVLDNRVRRAICPRCGRASAWWWIEPESMSGWKCDHQNSCGGYGQIV
jgi:hypothetical protein